MAAWRAKLSPSTRLVAGSEELRTLELIPGETLERGSVITVELDHVRLTWGAGDFFFTTDGDRLGDRFFERRAEFIGMGGGFRPQGVLVRGPIEAGRKITVLLGDFSGNGKPLRAPTLAGHEGAVKIHLTRPGEDERAEVARAPYSVLPAPAEHLVVNAVNPTARQSEFRLAALDRFGNLAATCAKTVTISLRPYPEGERSTFRVTLKDGKCSWRTPAGLRGPHLVTADCEGLRGASACVWPGFPGKGEIFFGDTHLHCSGSNDGMGEPADVFRFGREVMALAFVSISDHAYHLRENGKWPEQLRAIREATRHGDFVAVAGYEWDGRPEYGHVGVLFAEPPREVVVADSIAELWKKLEATGFPFITRPNHVNARAEMLPTDSAPAWGPYDWANHNESRQPLMEVITPRGSFEAEEIEEKANVWNRGLGASMRSALARGYHLGVTGGSDTHLGRPGATPGSVWGLAGEKVRTGLTAVLARELTPEAVWDALAGRRTYATSGIRALLDVRLNGHATGDRIEDDGSRRREISVRLLAPAPIREVAIIRNGKVWREFEAEGFLFEKTVADSDAPFELPCAAADDARHDYYYVRAIFDGGHVAVGSPVFLCSGPVARREGKRAFRPMQE